MKKMPLVARALRSAVHPIAESIESRILFTIVVSGVETLTNAKLTDDIEVVGGGELNVNGQLNFNGHTVTMDHSNNKGNAKINLAAGAEFIGNGTLTATVDESNAYFNVITTNGNFLQGRGITINGGDAEINLHNGTYTNNGNVDPTGGPIGITVQAMDDKSSFVNNSTFTVGSGSVGTINAPWTNSTTGTISENHGKFNLVVYPYNNAGNVTGTNGGTVSVAGNGTNTGTISGSGGADVTIGDSASTWINKGNIKVSGSTTTLTTDGAWSSPSGAILGDKAKINLGGDVTGALPLLSSGPTNITGTVNLNGGTENLTPSPGPLNLEGGTLENGKLETSPSNPAPNVPPQSKEGMHDMSIQGTLDVQGQLDGSGTVSLVSGSQIKIEASSTAGASIVFTPTTIVGGTGTISMSNSGSHLATITGLVTLGPQITILGSGTIQGSSSTSTPTVLEGHVEPGPALTFTGTVKTLGTVTLNTTSSELNCKLVTGGYQIPSGALLDGVGTVVGKVTVSGTIEAGLPNATGTLHLNGGLTEGTSAITIENVGGTAAGKFGELVVTGSAHLAGTLNIVPYDAFKIATGETFKNIIVSTADSGSFAKETGLPTGLQATVQVLPTSVSLGITTAPHLSMKEEPPASVKPDEDFTFQVSINNASNSVITTDQSVITATIFNGTTIVQTLKVQAINGVATFDAAISTNGTYDIVATDGTDTKVTSTKVTVSSGSSIDFASAVNLGTDNGGDLNWTVATTPSKPIEVWKFTNPTANNLETFAVNLNATPTAPATLAIYDASEKLLFSVTKQAATLPLFGTLAAIGTYYIVYQCDANTSGVGFG
jgi:hypothetical protein